MKKIIALFGVIFILLAINLFNLQQTQQAKKETTFPIDNPPEVIELKFGHHLPKESIAHKAAIRFADEVEKKTNGKVKITVFPNQELGNSQKMLELSVLGEIDIILTPTAKMSVLVPSMQYADLPFLFPTREDAYALLDGKVGDMLLRDLKNIDLLVVAFWEGGFKNFTANKPLSKIEDFKDVKMRVMQSRVIMEQFHALKAKPIIIDFMETKQALTDGVVHAQENSLGAIVSMEFYKVQSDFTLSEHGYIAQVLTFSAKSLSKFPLEIQNTLIQTLKETTLWQREETLKEDKINFEILKKSGINMHILSPEEKKRFINATAYSMQKYEGIIGAHIISATQAYFYEKYPQENIVTIGIDADLSMGEKGSGLAIKRGVELAVNEINAKGGLLGKRLVVVAKDHQGISTQARENIRDFINDKNIIAVIGGKHSAIVSSYMKDIQDNKVIFFSPWAAARSVTENGYPENYVFRVSLNDRYATKFLAQEALKKSSHPAIVVENSIWGKEALENINLALESKGIQNQEGFIINRGEKDFEKIFSSMRANGNDSVIMVLNSQEAQRIVTHMGEEHIKLPIISHWGIDGDSFFQTTKQYLKDNNLSFIQTFSLVKNIRKEAQNLAKNYFQTYHQSTSEPINAITGVVQGYDAVMLLAKAIEKCKDFNSTKVRASLENLDSYEGAIKTYKMPFDAVNHEALSLEDFFMAEFDKDGNIVPVGN
jgi:tripartite ATP-independent transporter DctP family solute receptor